MFADVDAFLREPARHVSRRIVARASIRLRSFALLRGTGRLRRKLAVGPSLLVLAGRSGRVPVFLDRVGGGHSRSMRRRLTPRISGKFQFTLVAAPLEPEEPQLH